MPESDLSSAVIEALPEVAISAGAAAGPQDPAVPDGLFAR